MEFLITLLIPETSTVYMEQFHWKKSHKIEKGMFDSTIFRGFQPLFVLFGVIYGLFLINPLLLNGTTTELPAPSRSGQNSFNCVRTALESKTKHFLGKMQGCRI